MTNREDRIKEAVTPMWYPLVKKFFDTSEADVLMKKLSTVRFLPDKSQIYNALHYTGPQDTKVVMLGQDPYPHQHAHGLAFSTTLISPVPASLLNIFKEIAQEYDADYTIMENNLSRWTTQGVLLLNTVLTVEYGKAGAHIGWGWEHFTSRVCVNLLKVTKRDKLVFILLGKKAEEFMETFVKPNLNPADLEKLVELKAPHPSPYSANSGFFGSGIFKKCNEILGENEAINWVGSLENVLPF